MSAEPNWVLQQRKAFTGWCNGHLADRGLHVKVLEEELQDGWVLHELMEIISNKKIKLEAKNPKTKFQKVGNLNHVFKFLESEKIKLVNIGSEDIFTANSKLILGFIWTIILRYHVQKGGSTNAKQELLDWVNKTLEAAGSETRVSDFKGSFSDSKAFVALVNYLKPGSVNPSGDAVEDMTNAFAAAETGLGIPNLLDAVLVNSEPDELSIMTYVSYYRAKEAQRAESKSDADASKTKAKGKGLKRAKAQKKAQFKVYTRNGDGQLVDVDNNSLKIRVTANDLQLENHTHPESKGKTKVSYTPKQPGTAKVEIEVNGTQIPESPFEVDVRDQNEVEADASKSRAYGPGLKAAQAGTPATFTVVARGPDGEKLADQLFDIEVVDANGNPVDTVTITDNGDGTYTVSYVVDQPGQYQVNVELDGEPLKGSPFSVTAGTEPVNNQCVDHKNSKAYGPGLESPKEKEPATFTVEVKDKDNEPIASGVSVQVDVSGTENPDVTVQDNGDGSFTVTYHPTKAGEYKVGVNVEEEPIQGSPFNVLVRSGLGDTKVHGPGLGHPHPNEATHFTVEALDKDGNLMADVDLKVQVEGPNGPEDAHIKKNDDGSFTVEYTPKNKGKYQVEVQVENAPVAGSPFQVLVTPDSDASRSEAAGPGLEKPKEDVPTHFTVSVKNKDGELVGEGGSDVQVKFSGPQDHEVTVTDNSDGTYPVTYTPNKPGHYNVEVTVDGTPIAGSPFQVEVLCSADPSQCTAHGDGLKQAQQYKKAQFTIEAKDKNGAPMKVGGNDFDIKTSLPEQPSIKDNEDGTYLVSYEPQEEGENVIDVSLDGTPIAGSPFTVPTSTADASSLHSEAKGKGLEKATVGHKSNFTVQVKDVKGKPVTKESTQVEVQVEGPEGNVDTQRDAKKKGKTEFTYKPTTAGDHTISVSVNGEAVQGSPFKLNVKEGADKSKIKVSGKGKSVAFNNKPAKFKIEAQDKSGNPVDNEEFEVSIKHIESGQEGKVTVGESKDGKYPVEYEVKELGKYELSVKYGDEHVDESPYSVTCKNGAKPEKTVVSKWSFTITARTESDELVDEEEDDFQVKIDGPVEIEAKTKALGKGKYRVTYKPSKEGQYTIHITLGGVPIVGSPFVQNY